MTSVYNVARYILSEIGPIDTMRLHKLCYFALADRLAASGELMFSEPFEAWPNGPVCYALVKFHKGNFTCKAAMFPKRLLGNKMTLEELSAINRAIERYGPMSREELMAAVHCDKPWLEARGDLPLNVRCRSEIRLPR